MAFTSEQLEAINREGSNIIVSAGAGSGKTAVLTERVIRKLKDGISISNLLVLTFTNEAASEMKARIRSAIVKNNLIEQLTLLDSAYITTFDSYALSLVKKYHYLLNISPNVGIIQDGIIEIKKYQILDKIFEELYGDSDFNNLIDTYCYKDDKNIKDFIISISNYLDLLTNKDDYIRNFNDNFYSDVYLDKVTLEYLNLIKEEINNLHIIYSDFINYANDNLINKLDTFFNPLFNGNSYDDYKLFMSNTIPKFMGVSEEGKDLKEELKKNIDRIKELLRFDNISDIKDKLLLSKKYTDILIKIVTELDREINAYKNNISMYEFNDISHMAISLVRDNLWVRNELKEYFNEIMVDEYQDTSDIQEEFLSYIDNNNIYMVGDIKQSIYRFRNANPYIFQNKYDSYSKQDGGVKIDLLNNFRSREETIKNINDIFNLIMDSNIGNADYLVSHNMLFGNKAYLAENTNHDNYMEVYAYQVDELYSKSEMEAFIVADDILDKIKNGYLVFDKKTSKLRKLEYSDISIITDRNKYLDLYRKIFEYKGIPSTIYMDSELNSDTTIMVIKNLINLVYEVNSKIENNFKYLFTSVARSYLFSYTDQDIYNKLNDNSYFEDEIIKIAKKININNPLPIIINDIINEFKVYEKLINLNDIDANMARISNLVTIGDNLNNLGYSLLEFINYIDSMNELGLSVTYSSPKSDRKAVKIMNIHKSKGLEFSLCYYTGLYNKFTIKDVTSRFLVDKEYGIIMPYVSSDNELVNNILKDLYVARFMKEEVSEKIRLFYVALTRAREKMIILYPQDDKEYNGYDKLVPSNIRMKYRSFLDIMNSLRLTDKYKVSRISNYTKDYNKLKIKDKNICEGDIKIENRDINIDYNLKDNKHYSKEINEIISLDKISDMEYGTKLHEIMEYDDFNNPKSEYVIDLLKLIPNDFINVYHEYEFNYTKDLTKYSGTIDLMIEYEKDIYIIDYKTKNISDPEYIKQVHGYKEYIEGVTDKNIKTYLYSIMDNKLMEV